MDYEFRETHKNKIRIGGEVVKDLKVSRCRGVNAFIYHGLDKIPLNK
ncbi:hypothetical protein A45J_1878 [hot springs metagenome]|uniref:Uncharacterized protein n=1 Tax=hot springs metagenome TaxID=433727 RepID=A0A5J4L5G0_9ZZZZ